MLVKNWIGFLVLDLNIVRKKWINDNVFDDIARHKTYESYISSRKLDDLIKSKENPHKIK